MRNIEMMDQVSEWMRRFAVLARARLKGWEEALTLSDAAQRAFERHKGEADKAIQDLSQSPGMDAHIKRFAKLSEVHAAALQEALRTTEPTRYYGPRDIFPGIAERLKALCISMR
ncbi:MAG: hypothetical protein WAN86_17085 [Hyphomicrobiaceae bacterium]